MIWLLVLFVHGQHPYHITLTTYTETEKEWCYASQWKDEVSEARCVTERKVSGSEYERKP